MIFLKLFSELKRRNIFKVATAYAIVAWLLIQIVTAIDEPLSLPDWFDTSVIVILALGFPIALIIAWAFELTPEGLKKTKDVDVQESISKNTGKKLNRTIIVVLSLAIFFLLIERVFFAQSISTNDSDKPSIAVLPFTDMSPDGDHGYFSDGLSEEILNVLAKVENMKVAGRTSSFKFRGNEKDIKEIGNQLGVAHVLEGSVRKSGDKLRITAQLINAEDGFHIWSETFDKEYSANNIFDIQDEISNKVLQELRVRLSVDGLQIIENQNPTSNTQALELYLKANQLVKNRQVDDLKSAIELYKQAIALDPEFASAYSHLTLAYNFLVIHGNGKSEDMLTLIKENADKAMLLDDQDAMSFVAQSAYFEHNNEWTKRIEFIREAHELDPNNPQIMLWYAEALRGTKQGRVFLKENSEKERDLHKNAYELDPLSPSAIQNLAYYYINRTKEYKKGIDLFEKNIRINPNFTRVNSSLIEVLANEAGQGKLDEAFIRGFQLYIDNPKDYFLLQELGDLAANLHLFDLAEHIWKELESIFPNRNDLGLKYYITQLKGDSEEIQEIKKMGKTQLGVTNKDPRFVSWNLENYYLTKDYQGGLEYLESYHPIYLQDSLTKSPTNAFNLFHVAYFLKHANDQNQSDNLAKLVCDLTKGYDEGTLDMNDQTDRQLRDLLSCASLQKNGDLFSRISDELYFKRYFKSQLQREYLQWAFDEILKSPETQEFQKRMNADIETMRNNIINYLKDKESWSEYIN